MMYFLPKSLRFAFKCSPLLNASNEFRSLCIMILYIFLRVRPAYPWYMFLSMHIHVIEVEKYEIAMLGDGGGSGASAFDIVSHYRIHKSVCVRARARQSGGSAMPSKYSIECAPSSYTTVCVFVALKWCAI